MPFLFRSAAVRGDAPAIVFPEGSLSFRALSHGADQAARRLLTLGVEAGEPVALKGNPDPDVLSALHGIWRVGGVPFPMNPRWTPVEEEEAAARHGVRFVLVGRGVEPVQGRWENLLLQGDGTEGLQPLGQIWASGGALPWSPGSAGLPEDRPAVHLLTSGTSGRSKSVSLTFGNLMTSAAGARERLSLIPDDRWLASLSLAHVGGLALVTRAAVVGSSLRTGAGGGAEAAGHLLKAGDVTHASLVPTMLHRIMQRWEAGPSPGSIRCLLIGGARTEERLLEKGLALGLPLALTYGLTEASSQVATAPPKLVRAKPGTVGPPLPGVEVGIREGGEILVRGPTVAPDQLGDDGWLHTGDLGHLDEDGHLWVTSRLSHRIISGGVNVDPEEVEAVFRTHPGVREVTVLGMPDPEWGERVVAVVVGEPEGLLEELERLARAVLSPAKRPKEVQRVTSLPRNPNGKVDRDRIRRLFQPTGPDRRR